MSIEIIVPMKQLLTMHGVQVKAELYGNFADALNELLRSQPDYDSVGVELHCQLMVKFPLYPYWRSADVHDKHIQFNCGGGSKFAKFMVEWLGFNSIDYEVLG